MSLARLRTLAAALSALGVLGLSAAAAAPEFDWGLPAGVAPPPVPAGNPMSTAKVELGQRLFYDVALSQDYSLSCDSCHQQHRGFSEVRPTHPGVNGQPGKRNAPGLANVAYLSPLTWADPSAVTLEDQAANPIFGDHPVEMGMAGRQAEVVRRLSADPCYRRQFAQAFPDAKDPVTLETLAKAVAAFERTLLSFDTP